MSSVNVPVSSSPGSNVAEERPRPEDASGDKPVISPPSVAPPTDAKKPAEGPAQPAATGNAIKVDAPNASAGRDIKIFTRQGLDKRQIAEIRQLFTADDRYSTKVFSTSMAYSIPLGIEEDLAAKHLYDTPVLDHFASLLGRNRLLLIAAKPDSGKGSTVISLAHKMRQRDPNLGRELLRVQPLDSSVRVNLREIASNERDFGARIVFFKDVLSRANRDLYEFLDCLDETLAQSLQSALAKHNSYLVFTADSHTLINFGSRLESLQVSATLPPLSPERLSEALNRVLSAAGFNSAIAPELRREILLSAGSVPRLMRFAKDYLASIGAGTAAVQQAFAKIDDISLWLNGDLAEDFEVWSFVFVLVLAQPLRASDGVPWIEFQEFYAALAPTLRTWTGQPPKYEGYRKERVCDNALLSKSQACIERDLVTGRDVVRFRDPSYVDRLWSTLLSHSKGLLNALVPSLRQLIQSDELRLRSRSAQILGRIGEIDPLVITRSIVEQLAGSDPQTQQAAVGYVFQGVLSSSDQPYVAICLSDLDELIKSSTYEYLWAAIAACKQIGIIDLSLALDKLKTIADAKLATKILQTHDIIRLLHQVERDLEKAEHKNETINLLFSYELLHALSAHIVAEHARLLFAIQYAIVSLCISLDPILVFTHLRRWMQSGEGLRALVCLIYLQAEGLAAAVRERSVVAEDDSVQPARKTTSNLIIVAMGANPEAALHISEFLADIFVTFNNFFPLELARYMKQAFFAHLRSWVESAIDFPRGLKATEDLFMHLLTSPVGELQRQTLEFLRNDEVFLKENSTLQKFARSVLKRGLTEATRWVVPSRSFPTLSKRV